MRLFKDFPDLHNNPGREIALLDAFDTPGITQFDCNAIGIGDIHIAAYADRLRSHPTIEHLGLANNNITEIGISILSWALKENPFVKTIALHENPIGAAGIVILADLRETNPHLEIEGLDLSDENVQLCKAALDREAIVRRFRNDDSPEVLKR